MRESHQIPLKKRTKIYIIIEYNYITCCKIIILVGFNGRRPDAGRILVVIISLR
jgi:hypothetical protein